jgi:hypothetical protein
MGRVFGIVLLLLGVYFGLSLWTKGVEATFAGRWSAPAPLEGEADTAADDPAPDPDEGPRAAPGGSRRVPITEYVRGRTEQDIERGAARTRRADR